MISTLLFKKTLPLAALGLAVLTCAVAHAKDMTHQTAIKSIVASPSTVKPGDQITFRASVVYDKDLRDTTPKVPLLGMSAYVQFRVFNKSKDVAIDSRSGIATFTITVPKDAPPHETHCAVNVLKSPTLRASMTHSGDFKVVR